MVKKNNWTATSFGRGVSPSLVPDEFLEEEVVILLQGNNMFGDAIYSYLKINGRSLREMFATMQAGKNFTPSDYGTVLAAGRGEPTEEVRREMTQTYHMLEVPNAKPPVKAFVQPKFFDDESA